MGSVAGNLSIGTLLKNNTGILLIDNIHETNNLVFMDVLVVDGTYTYHDIKYDKGDCINMTPVYIATQLIKNDFKSIHI